MKYFFEKIVELKKSEKSAAFAIIVKAEGSTPRKPGTKMIIMKDGNIIGTMGGGDLEKRVTEEALEVIRQGEPRITSFTLDIEKGKLDMMCGGKLDVYIEPILPETKLIIFGAGHITRSLAPLMKLAPHPLRSRPIFSGCWRMENSCLSGRLKPSRSM